MDKLKLANSLARIDSLIPKSDQKPKGIGSDQGSVESFKQSFKETFENLVSEQEINLNPTVAGAQDLKKAENLLSKGLKFSNHAIERMQSRGISFSVDRLAQLDEAVKKAEAKGSKDTLILMDDSAAIVSVKNKTVVTVMDKANLKENVFTNIDSTIVI